MLVTWYVCWFHSVRVPTHELAVSPNTRMPRYDLPTSGPGVQVTPLTTEGLPAASRHFQPALLGSAAFETRMISAWPSPSTSATSEASVAVNDDVDVAKRTAPVAPSKTQRKHSSA